MFQNDFQNLEDIDFESEEFQSLPAEIRHEILSEMKEQRRENALARIAIMPEVWCPLRNVFIIIFIGNQRFLLIVELF